MSAASRVRNAIRAARGELDALVPRSVPAQTLTVAQSRSLVDHDQASLTEVSVETLVITIRRRGHEIHAIMHEPDRDVPFFVFDAQDERHGHTTMIDIQRKLPHLLAEDVACLGDHLEHHVRHSGEDEQLVSDLRELRSNMRHNADEVALIDRVISRLDSRPRARVGARGDVGE